LASDALTAIHRVLSTLFGELLNGAGAKSAWVLNPEDPGLLRSLDKLSAKRASAPAQGGGPSIAAHVDHLRYGLQLLNRWKQGEEPFAAADYGASWRRGEVTELEWMTLRQDLRAEAHKWHDALQQPGNLDDVELTGVLASIVHLAYHIGAIRQVDRSIRGPAARD
jgi:hypothetical protein